jgi:hypothetical protein
MERRNKLAPSDGQGRSELTVTGYQSSDIPGLWSYIEDLIEDALRGSFGQHSKEDLFDELTNRWMHADGPHMQLWLAHDKDGPLLVLITEIVDWPSLRACSIVYMAGSELDRCLPPLYDVVETWARRLNCDTLFAMVRPGLTRKLKGWRLGPQVIVKDLKNEQR